MSTAEAPPRPGGVAPVAGGTVRRGVVRPWLREPRIALTVPGIIIMVPGTYAFQTVVLLDEGNVLAALQAASLGAFVVGAMALGLAAARLVSQRGWMVES